MMARALGDTPSRAEIIAPATARAKSPIRIFWSIDMMTRNYFEV